MARLNLIETFVAIPQSFFIECSHNLYLLFKIYLYELIIRVIVTKICQFLIELTAICKFFR